MSVLYYQEKGLAMLLLAYATKCANIIITIDAVIFGNYKIQRIIKYKDKKSLFKKI